MTIPDRAISIPTGTWRADVVHSSRNATMPDGSQALADEVTREADLSLIKA